MLSVVGAYALSAPEEYLAALKKKGGNVFVRELYGSADYDRLIDGVASGMSPWLKVAVAVRPFTDAGFSSELDEAMMLALSRSPNQVTAILSNGPFELEVVCGRGMFEEEASHYRRVLKALRSLKRPTAPKTVAACISAAEAALRAAETNSGKQ